MLSDNTLRAASTDITRLTRLIEKQSMPYGQSHVCTQRIDNPKNRGLSLMPAKDSLQHGSQLLTRLLNLW